MLTEKLYLKKDYDTAVCRAAELLKNGGIVAIPTETVYGLAASAYSDSAINKVFAAKGRPQDNPLIVHIGELETLYEIAKDIPEIALKCAESFWPGPFTMILSKTGKTAQSVSAGLDTVAVRMPSEKAALDIIKKSGLPLAAPSANTSGRPSPTTALHAEHDLDGKIDAIVYGNNSAVGVESTVVSFCTFPPRLLRPGFITVEEIREIIPDLVVDKAVLSEPESGERVHSPGMKYKHYSPKTEAFLVEGEGFAEFVNKKENAVAICFESESDSIKIPKIIYGEKEKPDTLAHTVFDTLRNIDELGVKEAYIHAPSKSGVGLAVYNRLIRACGFRVIKLQQIIGLTGPTGAGKSSLTEIAQKNGYYVIDCDKLARKAVEKQTDGLKALVTVFGEDILFDDGTLNRKKLAEKAFSSKTNTELLNKTIFPYITELVREEMKNAGKIILDAPTLFESGLDKICDKTVAVIADTETRLARITERDGIDKASAKLRISAGKSDEYYKERADFILYNNGDLAAFFESFRKILKEIF